jgi:MFS family permease
MADVFGKTERGKATAIASFLPYLGPALGPIVGGVVTQYLQWHWIFWIISIADAVLLVFGVFFIRETYTPTLLRRKAALIRNEKALGMASWSYWKDLGSKFGTNLKRPARFLFTRPVIQLVALQWALDFGIYCLLLSSFATLWQDRYHQSELASSLHYFAFTIGATSAAQVGGRVMDKWYVKQRVRHEKDSPEFRAPYMMVGACLVPVGIFWYGWSAQAKIHWIMPDIGAALFVCASFVYNQGLLAYQLDEFAEYSASANAASRIVSNLFGFAFPIFAPQLYARLGYGWGNSLLGFVTVVLGVPTPIVIRIWGEKIRSIGRKD